VVWCFGAGPPMAAARVAADVTSLTCQKQKYVASVNDTTIYHCTECCHCEGEAGHRAAASGSGRIYDPTTLIEWRSVPTSAYDPYCYIPGVADAG
jgi:hypothetical protein